jgi:lipopolysaccharide biosynthesis regulator YciM
MKRLLLFVGAILLVVVFGAEVFLNPTEVEFHPTHTQTFRPMLGLLLIFTFSAGALVAVLGGSLRNLGSTLSGWRGRRKARVVEQAGEWHRTGEALAWGGDLERSRTLLKKAWQHHPGNAAAALALAASYMDTGEFADAEQVLRTALARHTDDPDLRYALGEVLRRRGETDEAIRMLEAVRVRHPRAPRVLISLRDLYRESARWKEAADVQAAYLQTVPTDGRPAEDQRLIQFRYQAALALPDADARLDALDAVVRSDRTFVPGLVSLGDALVVQGRGEEAMRVWEKAFKAQPRLVFIERMLAQDSALHTRRAVTLLNRYSDRLDADSVHILLARIALAGGDLDRATAELKAVHQPASSTVDRLRAEILHRRGDHQRAWDALRHAADQLGASAADHRCIVCGRVSDAWTGYCLGCERWDTYRSGAETPRRPAA